MKKEQEEQAKEQAAAEKAAQENTETLPENTIHQPEEQAEEKHALTEITTIAPPLSENALTEEGKI